MNDMTIIATNRCRPEYRGLSPKEECKIRSRRTGVQERPGALPRMAYENSGRASIESSDRDAMILASLASGPKYAFEIRATVPGTPDTIQRNLVLLEREGYVKCKRAKHTRPIWSLPKGVRA